MKKILVLGAGMLQVPVIKRAREMGYHVVAADGNPQACGFRYSNKAICGNITSEEDMLQLAREEQIDGVIHPCSEVSMNVMGRINDELSLSGISKKQAIRATNKHLMRESFKMYNAPSPESILTISEKDAWEIFENKLGRNAILKPSRNSGSRGIAMITKNTTKAEFLNLYKEALNESKDNSVLIEEYINGSEFSVEIIVWNRKINILAVTDKKTTEAPYFVELGHNQPSCFTKETVQIIKEAAIAGVKALEVNNCACHAEVKLQNGKAYLIEVGARLGGDFISTELTHLSTGIDMVAAAVNCALGIEPYLEPTEHKHSVCIRFFNPKPGKLISISNTNVLNDIRVYDAKIYHNVGDMIPEMKNSLCRSGHVIVIEATPQKAIKLAEQLIEQVKFETV